MTPMTGGITIGQAAAFAGVTIKTVRHYHKNGLLAEPERDSSGYRRYGSSELLRLVRIRALAAAGVPLAEIGAMLDASHEEFTAHVADADRRLTERIDDLVARRETLRRLAEGEYALLPPRAAALLARLPEFGFSAQLLNETKEAMILVLAMIPEGFDDYLDQVERTIADPVYLDLMKRALESADWEPDDPRFERLATEAAAHLVAHPELLPTLTGIDAREDGATRYRMLSEHGGEQEPGWGRLTSLIESKLHAAGVDLPHRPARK